jgi:tRNA modification GTPase
MADMLRRTTKPVYVTVNKVDNSTRALEGTEFYSMGFEHNFFISSISGSGTGELLDAVTADIKEEPKAATATEELPEGAEPEEAPSIPKIAIVGQPNAGKSSLLNAMIGQERTIVSEIAGTTRDTIEEAFVIDGITFRLTDTAGIRSNSQDKIEVIGIERTFDKLQKASIIIYVYDAATTTTEELSNELAQFDAIHAIVIPVANKIDLTTTPLIPNAQTISLSAKDKTGIEVLKQRLIETVRKDQVKNDVIITNLRHYEALQHASEALQLVLNGIDMQITGELLAFDIRKALFHLGEITGDVTTDDLLANIFSKFCIGK